MEQSIESGESVGHLDSQLSDTKEDSKIIEDVLSGDDDVLKKGIDLFKAFSNEDAIKIFLYARNGIPSSTEAIKHLGMSQKRYYSRLKMLLDINLLEKVEGCYVYTAIGQVMQKMGLSLMELLKNQDRIELILNLSKSDSLSREERSQINRLLMDNSEIKLFLDQMITSDTYDKIEKISNYGELVDKINEEITSAKKFVYIATIYFEPLVMDAVLKLKKKGVMMKCLMSKKTMSKKMTKLRMLLSPKVILNIFDMMSSYSNVADIYREADLPFSFCIIDNEKCFFEFPNIGDSEFSLAFYLVENRTSERFSKFFEQIWESTQADQSPSLYKNI